MTRTELVIEFPSERAFRKDSFSRVLRGYQLGGRATWRLARVEPCPCYHILVDAAYADALRAKAATREGRVAVMHEKGYIDRFELIQREKAK